MTTYYVSSEIGSANNAGTSASAPLDSIQAAANLVKPGDTVQVMNGTYTGTVNITTSGTESAPITFEAAPGQTPVLDSSGQWNAINIQASNIVINGFTVQGDAAKFNLSSATAAYGTGNADLDGNGIAVNPSSSVPLPNHITIENNTVTNEPGGGIYTEGADYVQILNNNVTNNAHWSAYGNSGISVSTSQNLDNNAGPHIVISGNTASNNAQMVPTSGAGKITDGEGIILDTNPGYTGQIQVENNTSTNNGGPGVESFQTSNATISGNTVFGNNTQNTQSASNSEIFINQSSNNTVTGNVTTASGSTGTSTGAGAGSTGSSGSGTTTGTGTGTSSGGGSVTDPTGGTGSGTTSGGTTGVGTGASGGATPPTAPVVTVANPSLSVGPGQSVDLGVSVSATNATDNVTVNVKGLPGYETITDNLDHKTFSGGNVTLSAAEVNSGLTLNSSYSGNGSPTSTLTITASDQTNSSSSAAQSITVTDPPSTSGTGTSGSGSTGHGSTGCGSSGSASSSHGGSHWQWGGGHSNVSQWFDSHPGFAKTANTLSDAFSSKSGASSAAGSSTDQTASAGNKAFALFNQMMAGDFGHTSQFAQGGSSSAQAQQQASNQLTRPLH